MTFVRDLLQDALIEIGVLAPSDAMQPEDAAYALRMFNRLMGKWNSENLMVYTVNRQVFNLVSGQQVYTLGTGGDFNVPRPVRIQMASVLIANGNQPVEIPLEIITDEERQDTAVFNTPGRFPTRLWITGDVPLNHLWFWPVPGDSTAQVVLYTWGKTESFASINDLVTFPNAYEEFFVANLAIALAPSYSREPSPVLMMRASSARSAIEGMNLDPLYVAIDPALLGGSGRSNAIRSNGLVVD